MIMNLDVVILGNDDGPNLAKREKGIAIIVDVLRASTTIPTAMKQGITTFYVTKEVEDTRKASVEFDTLLMGERGCIKLPGFDFGNSPVEVNTTQKFRRSSASFTSSTGARRVAESQGSKYLIIGSIVNAKAVVVKCLEIIQNEKNPLKIVIIPTFTMGSIVNKQITEDQLGALIIAREFQREGVKLSTAINNEIQYLEELLQTKTLHELLLETEHGKKLINLECTQDIEFCSKINSIDIVSISRDDLITLTNKTEIARFSIE